VWRRWAGKRNKDWWWTLRLSLSVCFPKRTRGAQRKRGTRTSPIPQGIASVFLFELMFRSSGDRKCFYVLLFELMFVIWMCLGLSLLRNSLMLSGMNSSHLSCNSYYNSILAQITKQFNGPDVCMILVATSLVTEKISVTNQLTTQLHESRCKSNDYDINLMV
jgi:hypothetical protein